MPEAAATLGVMGPVRPLRPLSDPCAVRGRRLLPDWLLTALVLSRSLTSDATALSPCLEEVSAEVLEVDAERNCKDDGDVDEVEGAVEADGGGEASTIEGGVSDLGETVGLLACMAAAGASVDAFNAVVPSVTLRGSASS